MPFKSVFRFLSNRGWSNTAGANLNGPDQRWHRAELIPAAGSVNTSNAKSKLGHAASGTIYNDGNQQSGPFGAPKPLTYSNTHLATGAGVVDEPIVAPLAKPEPLADLDKPAFDSRQYSKQAATTSLSARERGTYGSGIVYEFIPKHYRAIKFADEDDADEDDPGFMSEAETSATVGASSYSRRRQGPYGLQAQQLSPYAGIRVSPQLALHQSMNRGFSETAPPFLQRMDKTQGPRETANGFTVSTSEPERKTGVVFLQYQGETKRAVLPVDPNENSAKTSLRSLDDVRALFAKAFPDELPLEYLRSSSVKVYIQDTSKTDFFYELDDLNDVKDRSILKLHEPSARPNSPPPPPTQPVPTAPDHQSANSGRLQHQLSDGGSPNSSYNRCQRRQSAEDMNYFSEPEFDAGGEYRLQKSASASNYYGGINAAYQQHRRHLGTLDRFYGYGVGAARTGARSPYPQGTGVPPKPDRHLGPGIPSGGRASVRGSYSPPVRADTGGSRHAYGHSSEQEESYSRIGYRDYVPSPTAEAAVDALYQQRPRSASRSGSATPVIDEEARVRMMNMEKQLASLSSLVHSALMSKGVSETVYKDLEALRKEIFSAGGPPSSSGGTRDDGSDSGSLSRFSDLSSDKGSYLSSVDKDGNSSTTAQSSLLVVGDSRTSTLTPTSIIQPSALHLTPDARHTLRNAKRRVTEVQAELKNLRRMAQLNAQCSRDVLKDAFDRIKVILNTNKHLHIFAAQAQQQNLAELNAATGDRKWVNQEEERYRTETRRVERGLSGLEKEVEELRQRVVGGARKLRMSEVETFTDTLTQIGRSAASLKNNFPNLEGRLRSVMSTEMEKVVREEKFLKDGPTRLDNALKRCKRLANTMVTMKKLALVQDPSAYYANSKRPPLPAKFNPPSDFETRTAGLISPSPFGSSTRAVSPPKEPSRGGALVNGGTMVPSSPRSNGGLNAHVLDNLLEELQNVAKHRYGKSTVMGNGDHVSSLTSEKRVGFADEIQIMQRDVNGSAGSDTIKRTPQTTSINDDDPTAGVNSVLRTNMNSPYVSNRQQTLLSVERRSMSPSPMASSFRAAIPFLHSGRLGTTTRAPSSINSEQAIYRRQQDQHFGFPPPPPPPPRFSSRNAVGNSSPKAASDIVSPPTSIAFRSEFEKKYRFFSSGGHEKNGSETPAAIVQTNAVDEESRFVRSASSSESVNSQDGQRRRLLGGQTELEKAPPPPPPRNNQETLEQRQHELFGVKQPQNRFVKFQLPDGHRLAPE